MDLINNNPFLIAIFMILMNLSSKHLVKEVPESWDKLFENAVIRKLIIFAIAFTATRNFWYSIIITLLFIIFFRFLLNEKSDFYILDKLV